MPPMTATVTQTITKRKDVQEEMFLSADLDTMEKLEKNVGEQRQKLPIVWRNVALYAMLHTAALVGAFQLIFVCKWPTVLWTFFLHVVAAMGITAGAHRYWSHRSFKATLPARIIFMMSSTVAFQNDVIEWARDHRCHHKWTDTEADPHNARRGFFYSHAGWLLCRKTPELKTMGAKIDISDLFNDPVLAFQRKHYLILVLLLTFLIPTVVPVYCWGESAFVSFYVAALFRYAFTLNATWLINSAAHMFGYKPYDSKISPVESMWTNQLAVGEGGHNFHHTFPSDYRASEFGYMYNWTRAVLDVMAWMGLIYDMKTASNEAIIRQMTNKGDGTRAEHHLIQ